MKRKVIIVTSIPLDEPVILNRLIPLFEQCSLRGYEPVLVGVDYSDVEVSSKLDKAGLTLDLHKSSKQSKHKNLLIRLVRDIYIASRLGKRVNSISSEASVVIATIPSMFIPLFVFKKSNKLQLCLDIRDLTWEYLIGGSLAGTILGRLIRRLLRTASKKFDWISVTNSEEKAYIEHVFEYSKSSLITVSNGVSEAQYKQLVTECQEKTSNRASLTVSYIGNVGIAQSFSSLIKFAENNRDISVNIIGSGARLDEIRDYISKRKVENINLTGRVGWDSVIDYYVESDILFLSLDTGYSSAVPSKLYEYLLIGKPIVFAGDIASKEFFKEFRELHFCPDTPQGLSEVFERITQSAPMSHEDIEYNRKLVEANFIRDKNWSSYLDQVLSEVRA